MRKCEVEGCNNNYHAKGYCCKHYYQVKKHGKVIKTSHTPNNIIRHDDYAEIILCNKKLEEVARAIIDLEDVKKIEKYRWYLNSRGYVFCSSMRKSLHRTIINCPDNMVIDHSNHNKLDNRKCNLRICTSSNNNMNVSIKGNNTSGITGVSWRKSKNRWIAQITIEGEHIHIGSFIKFEDAVKARKEAELKYFGEYRNQD